MRLLDAEGSIVERACEDVSDLFGHQIRNLQSLIEKRPHLAWAKDMQSLFRKAIHLGNRREQMTERGYQRQVTIIEKKLDQLLKRRFGG